jgi:hypothetical protein
MRKTIAGAAVVLSMLLFAQVALAAAIVPDKLIISLWPEYSDSQVFMVQQIELAAATPLPVEVRFAMPKGAAVAWAGQIVSTDTSKDLPVTPTVNSLPGYDEVVFTLTKSRVAQLEAHWDGLVAQGNNRSVTLDWVQRYPATRTLFEFQEPSQATKVKMIPDVAFTRNSKEGFKTYQTGPHSLAVGETLKVMITYNRPITTPTVGTSGAPAPATAAGGAAKNPISVPIVVLILVLGVVGIGALVYFDSRRQ